MRRIPEILLFSIDLFEGFFDRNLAFSSGLSLILKKQISDFLVQFFGPLPGSRSIFFGGKNEF